MCWRVIYPDNGADVDKQFRAKTADTDIRVYKTFCMNSRSFKVSRLNLFRRILKGFRYTGVVCEVTSYWYGYPYALGVKNPTIQLHVTNSHIDEGYHSYKTYKDAVSRNNGHLVLNFIIPSGSTYYENLNGEIVSSNIELAPNYIRNKEFKKLKKLWGSNLYALPTP